MFDDDYETDPLLLPEYRTYACGQCGTPIHEERHTAPVHEVDEVPKWLQLPRSMTAQFHRCRSCRTRWNITIHDKLGRRFNNQVFNALPPANTVYRGDQR